MKIVAPLSPWDAGTDGGLENPTTSEMVAYSPMPFRMSFTNSALKSPNKRSSIKRTPLAEVATNILASHATPTVNSSTATGALCDATAVPTTKPALHESPNLIDLGTPVLSFTHAGSDPSQSLAQLEEREQQGEERGGEEGKREETIEEDKEVAKHEGSFAFVQQTEDEDRVDQCHHEQTREEGTEEPNTTCTAGRCESKMPSPHFSFPSCGEACDVSPVVLRPTSPVLPVINVKEVEDDNESSMTVEPIQLSLNIVEPEKDSNVHATALEARVEALEAENQQLIGEVAELDNENAKLKSEIDAEKAERDRAVQELAEARQQLTSLEASMSRVTEPRVLKETPTTTRAMIQQLREELSQVEKSRDLLQARLKELEAATEAQAMEHASLLDFLALERDVMMEELGRKEKRAVDAEERAQKASEVAERYDRDRITVASNLEKAEKEVDVLAQEVGSLSRRLNYVSGKLSSELPVLEMSVPSIARLARELAVMKSGWALSDQEHAMESNPKEHESGSESVHRPTTTNGIGAAKDRRRSSHSVGEKQERGRPLYRRDDLSAGAVSHTPGKSTRSSSSTTTTTLRTTLPPLPKSAFKSRQARRDW